MRILLGMAMVQRKTDSQSSFADGPYSPAYIQDSLC